MFSPIIKPISGEEPPAMSMTVLPNELVTEILTRLPGKQVGRCKCVCKPWQKIIRSRPFMETYRERQRGMLFYWWENISREDDESGLDMRRFHFFHCPLRRPEELPEEFSPLPELGLVMWKVDRIGRGLSAVSQLVHGLLCVGEGEVLIAENFRLTIHNICTGEKMRVPNPLPCVESYSTYHLGYDPVSRVYKLLRLIYSYDQFLMQGAHIMTLRPPSGPLSTWRELDYNAAGICDFHLVSHHVLDEIRTSHDDGMLCWIKTSAREEKVLCDRMLCFDLNVERFRLIDCPGKNMRLGAVTRFKDRLALWIVSHGGDDYKVNGISCYVQEDDEGKNWSKFRAEIMNILMKSGGFAVPSGYKISYSSRGERIVNDADEYNISFASSGQMLVKNPDESWRVYSCSRDADKEDVLCVGKFPDGAAPKLDRYDLHYSWWNTRVDRLSNGRLTRLMEGNYLYLPLDDVLSGATAAVV